MEPCLPLVGMGVGHRTLRAVLFSPRHSAIRLAQAFSLGNPCGHAAFPVRAECRTGEGRAETADASAVGWTLVPKHASTSLSLEPGNVAYLEKRFFANITKLKISRRDCPGLFGWALNPMARVLRRERRGRVGTQTKRKDGHVNTEAETGVMPLHPRDTKDRQRPPEARKRHGEESPSSLQKELTLPTP